VIFRTFYYVEFSLECSNLLYDSVRNVSNTQMLGNIFLFKVKVWNYVLGRRWEICKDILATEKVIRLITGVHERESCRHMFRKFQILTGLTVYFGNGVL
jgi:hypothetical protein